MKDVWMTRRHGNNRAALVWTDGNTHQIMKLLNNPYNLQTLLYEKNSSKWRLPVHIQIRLRHYSWQTQTDLWTLSFRVTRGCQFELKSVHGYPACQTGRQIDLCNTIGQRIRVEDNRHPCRTKGSSGAKKCSSLESYISEKPLAFRAGLWKVFYNLFWTSDE